MRIVDQDQENLKLAVTLRERCIEASSLPAQPLQLVPWFQADNINISRLEERSRSMIGWMEDLCYAIFSRGGTESMQVLQGLKDKAGNGCWESDLFSLQWLYFFLLKLYHYFSCSIWSWILRALFWGEGGCWLFVIYLFLPIWRCLMPINRSKTMGHEALGSLNRWTHSRRVYWFIWFLILDSI